MIIIDKPEIILTEKGCSYFEFIDEFWLAKDSGNNRAFHRLCSLMRKMDAQSSVMEKIDECSPELEGEIQALKNICGEDLKLKIYRFTFLSEKVSTINDIKQLSDDKFYASAILINHHLADNKWQSYLYQAIVCKPKLLYTGTELQNYYIHVYRNFKCSVNISSDEKHDFKIQGTFFCQQNAITSVCAHAALCMTLNNMPDRKERLIFPEDVNKILKIDHKKKKVSADGLSDEDVFKFLKDMGFNANWLNFFEDTNTDYAEYIYRYIEGGCPVLLVFTTCSRERKPIDLHVVPVIGHNLNSDSWRGEAEIAYKESLPHHFCCSSSWVNNFIIHDDNFGMYLCLPIDALRNIILPKYDPKFRPYLAIAIVPSEIVIPADEAERVAKSIIRDILEICENAEIEFDNIWIKRIADRRTPKILRTMLVNREKYENHLKSETDFENNKFSTDEITAIIGHLPDYFWLTEITLPDLYTANKHKLIDLLYRCDKKLNDMGKEDYTEEEIANRLIQIRFPGTCYINRKSNNTINLSVKSHYPLYRNYKESRIPEW